MDETILQCLEALAVGHVRNVQDWFFECFYCTLDTSIDIQKTIDDHDETCPITLARKTLAHIKKPIKKWFIEYKQHYYTKETVFIEYAADVIMSINEPNILRFIIEKQENFKNDKIHLIIYPSDVIIECIHIYA